MRALAIMSFVLLFNVICAQEQSGKLTQLKNIISSTNQDIDFNNKLVFISLWKITDIESRDLNKEAYRVYKIYEKAKLMNGEKGTVFISVVLDADSQSKNLAVSKDGIEPSVVFSDTVLVNFLRSEYNIQNSQNNIVFDKTGEVQYQNLPKDQIFSSLRNLITR